MANLFGSDSRNSRGGNGATRSNFNGIEFQDAMNDIYDIINGEVDTAGKCLANYSIKLSRSGNTNSRTIENNIRKMVEKFPVEMQRDILLKALAATIANA